MMMIAMMHDAFSSYGIRIKMQITHNVPCICFCNILFVIWNKTKSKKRWNQQQQQPYVGLVIFAVVSGT